jgi:hypothetical protein
VSTLALKIASFSKPSEIASAAEEVKISLRRLRRS